jgi:hypothetical protein
MKRQINAFIAYTILALLYVVINFVMPISHATETAYHLNNTQYRMLTFSLILPLLGIWFAAFYGYAKLSIYVAVLKNTAEGKGFAAITTGVMWLAWGLPIAAIISALLGGIAVHAPQLHDAFVIINNYVNLAVTLAAFTFISRGTRRLTEISNLHPSRRGVQGLMLGFISLGVLYCYLTIRSIETHMPSQNPYHMPMWLILLTIIVPYLYAWFMGLFSAYEISLYSKNMKGVLYKQALGLLAVGISAAIISSIIIQYVSSISPHLAGFALGYIVMIIYLLLLVYSVGYILIAIGANKLRKIEEV